MRKFTFLLLVPILVIFGSSPRQGTNPHLQLINELEKEFKYLKKEILPDRVVYKKVFTGNKTDNLQAQQLTFYINTPFLVGRALQLTSVGANCTCNADRLDFVYEKGKLYFVIKNLLWSDNQSKITAPEIVNNLVWNNNRLLFFATSQIGYREGKDTFNDTFTFKAEAVLDGDIETLSAGMDLETSKILDIKASALVKNISPELVEALKDYDPSKGKLQLDNKTTEMLLNIVPDELNVEIKLKPFVEELIQKDEETASVIREIEKELKQVKKGSLDERILLAALHILKGESNSVVIKIKNRAGITLAQVIGIAIMVSMSPNVEQAVKIISPYLDIKIVDF